MIETHAHLDFPEFDDDRDAAVTRAHAAGVHTIINIGTDFDSCERSLALAERYDRVFAVLGIHPHDAKSWDGNRSADRLKRLADHPKVDRAVVVAVPHAIKGEMPVAVVKLKEGKEATAEEFESWADERIAAYKRPRAYLFTDSIPMTFSLKPLRKDLRQWAGEVLGADWGER